MEIKLQAELEKAVKDMGYSEWTEIQERTMPLLQQGKDVIAQSHTGSGKTAAFGLPSLEKLNHGAGLQMLILVPTRELCVQVSREMHKFSKYKKMNIVEIYGGVSIMPQMDKVRHADIVVGTPGRMLDHMERRTINLSKVKILVLDEADKMFEMGFVDDVKRIISQIPRERQTMMFSATMSSEVQDIVRHHMVTPEKVKVQSYVDPTKLTQIYYNIDGRDKLGLLVHLLKKDEHVLTLIFCATRHMTDAIARNLSKHGIRAEPIHGGLSQAKRQRTLDMFHTGKLDVLVASDVAARGLDIKNVSHVVNYDIPKTSQDYIHRIGRTARAGQEGKVISLLSSHDHDNFRRIQSDRSLNIRKEEVPQFEKIVLERGHREGGFGGQRGGHGGRQHGGGYGGHRSHGGGYGNREDRGPSRSGYGNREGGHSSGRSYGNRSSGPKRYGNRNNDRSGPMFRDD